jgi:protein Cut8
MDSRSPLAFLQQNSHLNTFPRLISSRPLSPRASPTPSSSISTPIHATTNNPPRLSPPANQRCSPSVKRKASDNDNDGNGGNNNDDEDSVMSTSPRPSPRTLKRPRRASSSSLKRPLPISRILDNLDKPALVTLLSTLLSRHPGLVPEIQALAPKITAQSAMGVITKLHHTFNASFPYGGDKAGEYAYSRVHAAYTALLSAIQDYTSHFLPPTSITPPDLLQFLDSVTHLLHQLPLFDNPIHNIARETAFADITSAWELGIRYFIDTNGSFAFMLQGWLDRFERHAVKEESLRRVVEGLRNQVSWTRST